jgi:hypothetical protein
VPRASRLLASDYPFVVVGRERVREPIVGRCKGLIIFANLVASESIEEPINVDLPLIDRLIVADELG